MNKEEKVTSLKLSKKIYELAKKKGIELESEYFWKKYYENGIEKCAIAKTLDSEVDYPEKYPALDTAEWGMILPDTINFRDKETYSWIEIGKIGNTWNVIYRVGCANADIKITDDILAEAMGKMYYYLLDNNLI